jgi:hypothetical protein
MGVHHNVESQLPVDISLTALKDRQHVCDYFAELFQGRDDQNLAKLSRQLVSPVKVSL